MGEDTGVLKERTRGQAIFERFVHNTQERALAANDGKTTKAEAKNATVSSTELLEFMRNEMASDAANMQVRKARCRADIVA